MILFVSIALSIILSVVAALHAYWATGGYWPGHNEKSLARTVVGSKGILKMPPGWLAAVVATAIFVVAMFPVLGLILPTDGFLRVLLRLGFILFALIFIIRGAASFTPYFRKLEAEEPFVSLDRKYYGPLCLGIGFGFVFLLV